VVVAGGKRRRVRNAVTGESAVSGGGGIVDLGDSSRGNVKSGDSGRIKDLSEGCRGSPDDHTVHGISQ
jgi:hypothetical protein